MEKAFNYQDFWCLLGARSRGCLEIYKMTHSEKIYIGLCALFSIIMVIGNLIYQKFVSLYILPFHTFELSVGVIFYPLTFLITDLITEFYGKAKAQFCVRLAICMSMIAAFIIMGMDFLPATPWSNIDNATFHRFFGMYNVAFMGSMIACYTSQALDITLYLWIRRLTKGKYLWMRNNGSTAFSLLIDTTIVISFMTIFGILSKEQMIPLILNSYSFKLFFTICSTPLFYLCVHLIRSFTRHETT